MTRTTICLAIFVFFGVVLGAASPASARTCTWTGQGDGVFWSDENNWDDASGDPCEPGAGDTAIINGSVELASGRTVNELQLAGTLTIDGGATLIVNYLFLDSGSIGGDGDAEVDQEANFSGGTISVAITLPSDSNNSCGTRLRIGEGNTFTNNGTLSGSCFIDMEAGTTIDNYGVIEAGVSISVVGALDNGQEEVTPYPVVNNKPGATMQTGADAIFNNEGTVDLQPNGAAEFSGGGTSSGTFIVPAETSPNDGFDNARLRFGERFGITPHDLTGATIQGGGTVTFDKLRSPLNLTNVTYDLSGAPEALTRINGADVTFPGSMTLGGLGEELYLFEEEGRPGILTVDHDVSVRELRMDSPSGAVAELGGSGTLTVTTFLDLDGLIRQKAVTFGPGVVPTGSNIARIDNLDLADGATVVNEGVIGAETFGADRIRMGAGTSWANDGTLRMKTGTAGEGIDTLGTPSSRPTFTNNGLLQFIDDGTTAGVLGVDLDNAGTFRLGYGVGTVDNPQVRRGVVNVTGGFTNQPGAEIAGTGFLGWANAAQVTNDGRVAPGHSVDPTGILEISNFVMDASATLDLDLVGGAAADEDELRATGTIALDGTLNVTLDDVPLDTYTLVGDNSSFTEEQISDTFAQANIAPNGYTTSLNYNENGTNDSVTLDVTGTPYPLLSAVPADLDFRDAEVGTVETVEIENVGSGTLTLSGATLSGSDATRFDVAQPSFPVDLSTGQTVEVAVQVVGPETSGSVTAQVDLAHNGDADGTATTAIPLAADQITNPNFGEQAGYFFANSTFFADDAPSRPAFDWIDLSGTGTDRIGSLPDDGVIGPFNLGFSFRFFGQDYTQYWISSNGWITFTDPGSEDASSNETIPTGDAPNALVAWFWDDLDPSDSDVSGRHLYTQTTTVNGTDAHVITFERYPEYNADADGWITGQVVLLAGPDATTNGAIKLQYKEHGASIDLEGATVGIEDAAGGSGLEYRYDARGGPLFGSPLAVQIGPDATALPVELAGFEAAQATAGVQLRWQTASETNNSGFAVERRADDGAFAEIGFVDGAGTTAAPRRYRFIDRAVPFAAEALTYRLRQVDADGSATYGPEVRVRLDDPDRLALRGNAPNPFARRTTLRYTLPRAADVHLSVYDALGRRVATLAEGRQPAGRKERVFDAGRLPSGLYLVRLQADDHVVTRRVTVVR
ncbi:MAG: T9SS type A sorting domain-containing protein [Salinivenus sp.]